MGPLGRKGEKQRQARVAVSDNAPAGLMPFVGGRRWGLFVMLRGPFVGTGSLGRARPPRKEAGRKARLCRPELEEDGR